MEEEDTVCKTPLLKRKQGSETCGSKAKKSVASGEQEEQTESMSKEEEVEQAESESSEEEEMEDGAADSQPLTDSPLFSASQLDELHTVHSRDGTKSLVSPKSGQGKASRVQVKVTSKPSRVQVQFPNFFKS